MKSCPCLLPILKVDPVMIIIVDCCSVHCLVLSCLRWVAGVDVTGSVSPGLWQS